MSRFFSLALVLIVVLAYPHAVLANSGIDSISGSDLPISAGGNSSITVSGADGTATFVKPPVLPSVTTGSSCGHIGAQAYDPSSAEPVFCNNSSVWAASVAKIACDWEGYIRPTLNNPDGECAYLDYYCSNGVITKIHNASGSRCVNAAP